MAGHSKWANIQHRKGRQDKIRAKIFSKLSKEITIAAKMGDPDPDKNPRLRLAVKEAKGQSMPKDNIERAIKKGAGEGGDGANFEDVRYEGYGANGVAVIVDCLTDNRNRTAPEMRLIFTKHGGNLGANGCVSYMFQPKGIINIEADKTTEEQIMDLAVEAGAEDVQGDANGWTVSCEPTNYLPVKEAIEAAGIEIVSSELTMLPDTPTEVTGKDVGKILRRELRGQTTA